MLGVHAWLENWEELEVTRYCNIGDTTDPEMAATWLLELGWRNSRQLWAVVRSRFTDDRFTIAGLRLAE
jgi:hypothetical protein